MNRVFLPLLILLFSIKSFGQNDSVKRVISKAEGQGDPPQSAYTDPYDIINYKCLSSEAYKFQETSFLDVQNSIFYGRFNYSLPLYEIKTGGITIPISLNYSSGGLKVEEQATNVGLGWVLNTGGLITREVKGGVPDYDNYTTTFNNIDRITTGWNVNKKAIFDQYNTKTTFDQAPDEFILSALGFSDRFVEQFGNMSCDGNNNIYKMEYATKNNMVDISKITLITPTGLEMTFIPVENLSTANLVNDYVSPFETYLSGTSAWGLESVKDINSGREVKYVYDIFRGNSRNFSAFTYLDYHWSNHTITQYYTSRRRLLRIQWDGGQVLFRYGSMLREDIEKGEELLSKIQVVNSDGVTVKQLSFGFDYFRTPNQTNPVYNNCRLKLVSLTEQAADGCPLPPYKFSYFEPTTAIPFPSLDDKSRDYWGYYNNSRATSLIPKLYFYRDLVNSAYNSSMNAYYPIDLGIPKVEMKIGVDRSPNESACKIGMLKQVSTPTGGFHEFDYELNEFILQYKDGGVSVKGGGLRVKYQNIIDGASKRELIYNYNFNGISQGIISRYPSFAHFQSYEDLQTNTNPDVMTKWTEFSENSLFEPLLLNGAYVGYSRVEEVETGNGIKIYHFFVCNSDHLFDEVSLSSTLLETPFIYGKAPYYERTSDLGYVFSRIFPLVGKLVQLDYLDKNENPVKTSKFIYISSIRKREAITSSYGTKFGKAGFQLTSTYELKDWFVAKESEAVIEYPTDGSKPQFSQTRYVYGQDNRLLSKLESEKLSLSLAENKLQADADFNYSQVNYYYSNDLSRLGTWFPCNDAKFSEAMSAATATSQVLPVAVRKAKVTSNFIGSNVSKEIPVSDVYFHYGLFGGKVLNDIVSTRQYSSDGVEPKLSYAIRISDFDTYGRPTLFKKGSSETMQFASWLQAYDYPKCHGITSENGDTPSFTSFEPNEGIVDGPNAGAIISDGDVVGLADSPFGDYAMHLNNNTTGNRLRIDKNIPKGNFKVTFWYKGDGVINGNQQGEWFTTETWKLFTENCPGNQSVDFSFDGDVYIDNVRVVPNEAQLQTNTYRGMVGTLSQEDANGEITRYRYDRFNRLSSMLDGDGNILKAYKYSYGLTGDTGDTPTTTAASKSFTFNYSPGVYITVVDDYDHHEETRAFDSGSIQGSVLITDGLTGNKLEAPFSFTVTSSQDIPRLTAWIVSAVSSAINASNMFSNVTSSVEGGDLIVKISNPNIATDISRFTVTTIRFYELPSFATYGNSVVGSFSITN